MKHLSRFLFFVTWILLAIPCSVSGQEVILTKKISIPRQNLTLYQALAQVSEKADCFFIYSSDIVDNSRKVRIAANQNTIKEILDGLFEGQDVAYREVGKHILIYRAVIPVSNPESPVTPVRNDSVALITIRGEVRDKSNLEPIPYASIGIKDHNIGTITNQDGFFQMKVPAQYEGGSLVISHLGFLNQVIPLDLFGDQRLKFLLDRRVISIQEVIIRYIDPVTILSKAIEKRKENNNREPVYLTTFYREGVQKNDKMLTYSEAVFKVFKSSYELNETADQVKLLKSRKLSQTDQKDTISLKLKAGILAGLQLDIVKCLPDFLDPETFEQYTFSYSDLISYNHQDAYAIEFSMDYLNSSAYYKGMIYVDVKSYAILGADFEVDSRYLDKAASELIKRKSRKLLVKFEKISYSVSYVPYGNNYFLNHARCDLSIKTRLKNKLQFDHFSTFMEVVNCQIDTVNVHRFVKQEQINPGVIFSDIPLNYDALFWGDFNFIAPEEKLEKAINLMRGKIEKIE
ncbi:MAG: carboxypeptidase-like regulatory domain-containing protein [Bacteroidales bacterium]|nr:carboxypeptidase-like regulatory domain-containing protein [Bacteroidales bacterium]